MGKVIRNLAKGRPLTEISRKSDQNGSDSVKIGSAKTKPDNPLKPPSLKGLVTKRVFENLVDLAGVEPEVP